MHSPKPSIGAPYPLGCSINGVRGNFSLYSHHTTQVILGLFSPGKASPDWEFPMHRTEDIWHICLENIPKNVLYAFRCEGPFDNAHGLLFQSNLWLTDPYAKILETTHKWGDHATKYMGRPSISLPFDWQGVSPPCIPLSDLIIYEMHVGGFTRSPSSGVKHPGTFGGVVEKIPYLKELGITAVELLPVFEFDDTEKRSVDGKELTNYWGYSTMAYFAPHPGYCVHPETGNSYDGPPAHPRCRCRERHESLT